MTANVFNIKTPQIYRCNVHRYHNKLSRLYIRAFKGEAQEPAFYLLFTDVGYFEGPMNWQGVGFRLAPARECLTLMQKAGLLAGVQPELASAIAEMTHLYLLDTPATIIKIIAGQATRLNEIPTDI
ncbi:MAG: hypothetical protein U0694_02505 [Anaerolineae bacterium]